MFQPATPPITCPAATGGAAVPPPALDLARHVGKAGWARLPAAVQRRFGLGHGEAVYAGRMDLRCSPAGRVFAWLSRAFGSPLTGLCCRGIAARVRVYPDGRGGVVWERSFGDGDQGARVCSTKEPGPDGQLSERTAGGLGMVLDVFEEGGALVFQSRSFFLALGRLRLPVPAWLSPGRFRVTHADLGAGRFRFTLTLQHPLWGETFHQSGVFADPADTTDTL